MRGEIREALERLRPAIGERADILWALYLSADRELREDLEQNIRLLDLRHNRTGPGSGPPPLPPPEPGALDGRFRLGEVVYPGGRPAPFGLQPGELLQHLAIFGRSGAGKTNTVLVLLRSLLERRVPFLIFDWKRNYRDLLAASWVPEGRVLALTPGRDLAPLRWNPLRPPPGTGARTWLKKLIEIIAHAYFLGEGVMYLLQEAIDAAYRQAGVYQGSTQWPTFHDVLRILKARKVSGREANWMASTLRTLGAITFGPMAETVCAGDEDTDLGFLLGRNVILELDALTDSDKVFLVESLLLHIHHLRLAEPDRETLKHVILVEEAHHVFLRSKQELSGGEPVTDVILREIRELGEAIVLVDQHPSQIAVTALGNTYCTIAMNLKHRADVGTVADACLLEPDQKDHLGRLPVGMAVVKLQDRWTSPFIVRFPHLEIRKGSVTDAMIAPLAMPGARCDQLPSPGITESPPRPAVSAGIPEIPAPPKSTPADHEIDRFLADILEHPASGVTERYRRLELSRRKGTVLKRHLIGEGLAREVPVALPGGRVTLLELTPAGRQRLGAPPKDPRRGGAEHQYWVQAITTTLQKEGLTVEVEYPMGEGQAIDLVGERDGERIAVEIEVSGRRLDASLQKLRRVTADRKIVACSDHGVRQRALRKVDEGGSDEIEVIHVWGLLQKKKKEEEQVWKPAGAQRTSGTFLP